MPCSSLLVASILIKIIQSVYRIKHTQTFLEDHFLKLKIFSSKLRLAKTKHHKPRNSLRIIHDSK